MLSEKNNEYIKSNLKDVESYQLLSNLESLSIKNRHILINGDRDFYVFETSNTHKDSNLYETLFRAE